MYNNVWSKTAITSYLESFAFIQLHWPEKHANALSKAVDKLIDNLANGLVTCKACLNNKKYHLCVVSKQTSLIYKVQSKKITIVSFVDNRSNHLYQ